MFDNSDDPQPLPVRSRRNFDSVVLAVMGLMFVIAIPVVVLLGVAVFVVFGLFIGWVVVLTFSDAAVIVVFTAVTVFSVWFVSSL